MQKEIIMGISTDCLHAGYNPSSGEPGALPIYQSTAYRFESSEVMAGLFNMPVAHIYSRISNPTTDAVEKKIAKIEGGVGAMCTSSGQAATLMAVMNLCSAGDSIVSTAKIYGGVANMFSVLFKRMGIECIFIDGDADEETISNAVKPNTKCIYGETIANPALSVLDMHKLSAVAKKHKIPFIVDNTFATAALCRPLEHGADIVVHSTSKYMDGHAVVVGGVIVDAGRFDYTSGKFPDFCTPDESYHGIVYTRDFGEHAYLAKARMQLMRDMGCTPSPHSSFLLNLGLETLTVRMQKHCENALAVAQYLQTQPAIETVRYPALPDDNYHGLYKKYLSGASGVLSVDVKGGRSAAERFCDALKLVCREVHVADIRSCVLHPAGTTHRQMSDAQLAAAGVGEGLVRISVGLEDAQDIIADMEQAIKAIG